MKLKKVAASAIALMTTVTSMSGCTKEEPKAQIPEELTIEKVIDVNKANTCADEFLEENNMKGPVELKSVKDFDKCKNYYSAIYHARVCDAFEGTEIYPKCREALKTMKSSNVLGNCFETKDSAEVIKLSRSGESALCTRKDFEKAEISDFNSISEVKEYLRDVEEFLILSFGYEQYYNEKSTPKVVESIFNEEKAKKVLENPDEMKDVPVGKVRIKGNQIK